MANFQHNESQKEWIVYLTLTFSRLTMTIFPIFWSYCCEVLDKNFFFDLSLTYRTDCTLNICFLRRLTQVMQNLATCSTYSIIKHQVSQSGKFLNFSIAEICKDLQVRIIDSCLDINLSPYK